MNRRRFYLAVLLLLVFIGSTAMLIRHIIPSHTGQEIYRSAANLSGMQDSSETSLTEKLPAARNITYKKNDQRPDAPANNSDSGVSLPSFIPDAACKMLQQLDLQALQDVNPDVIGWIFIPGTNISYPLLQGDDNHHYLDHTWENKAYYAGSIFMDSTNKADLSDFNTILYGHNLLNKTMFSNLHLYKDPDFFEKNPYVYIATDSGIYRYLVFAAFEVPTNAACYWMGITKDSQKNTFLEDCLGRSILNPEITPNTDDAILTMSTCTGVIRSNRWVVQAMLEGVLELPKDDSIPESQIFG